MTNEVIFLFQILAVALCTFIAFRIGREALMTWIALQGVMANLFVLKQIVLFHLQVTCSDVYAVGSFLSLNLLQEFYDAPFARMAIRASVIIQAFFLLMGQFHLGYVPSPSDTSHEAFTSILTLYPRICLASLFVFYLVQRLDVVIFQALKRAFPQASFAFRNGIGLVVSQVLDTVLFSVLGLWGIAASLGDIMIMSLAIKLMLVAISSPLTLFVKQFKTGEAAL
jgi:uncharacterized integral membrane protein (TIGR00697 family)